MDDNPLLVESLVTVVGHNKSTEWGTNLSKDSKETANLMDHLTIDKEWSDCTD